ncbi:phosphatase PAP2 family protein [Paenibacillus sp. FSL M7-1455]|jgi:undecaprenyl-diphosphatase|uniref:Phosphatidylglycerophosphatase B n=1 Tax=Paenibacillus cookii TaxID=157839 RepID=A0ABQ4LZ41_9BACL|nr:phosphatase PAP2 family protein [Paenibacillus cookii]KHF34370.1 putative undecaprenyl-diphosphatase YbjG [Paenibacillus sp. P1XP2]GIO68408.1 phosphatidylglycerophosphatase B [Paenibacillus cookii]
MTLRRERLRKLITAAFIFAVLFLIVAVLIETGHIAWFDDAVISAVQGLENDGLTRVMKWFTFLGSSLMAVILSVLAFFFLMVVLKHRRELLMFLTAVGGSELWNLLLKYAIQRDRPNTHRLIEITGYSFPSGHSMGAFSLYGAFAFLVWRHIPFLAGRIAMIAAGVALTLLIGISRIYLGVHYPSDVLGGYLASAAWLMVSILLFEKYWRHSGNLHGKPGLA